MGDGPTPLSASNPRIAHLRRLQGRRRARLDAGEVVLEGPVVITEAVRGGAPVTEVFVDGDAFDDATEGSALAAAVAVSLGAGVPVHRLGPGLVERLSDTVTAQGLLAVARRPEWRVDDLPARPGPVLVLVGVADPGNVGTLVRAAEAAGAAGVVTCAEGADPFAPKTVRASAGSALRLPVVEAADALAVVAELARAGRRVVATVARDGEPPEEADLTGPVAVLVGSEAHGLPAEVVAAADGAVTIPLAPSVESLNAAVAGAVVLFEAARQRRAAGSDSDWTTAGPTDRLGDR